MFGIGQERREGVETTFRLEKTLTNMNLLFGKLRLGPEVYPLVAILTGACGLATFFGARAALKYPDVAWDHHNNPHPWLSVKPKEQRKLFSHHDYSKIETVDRPEI